MNRNNFGLHFHKRRYDLQRLCVVFSLMLLALYLSYANSFDCLWHFDDYENIVNNASVHFKEISWDSIEKSFHGIMRSGRWSRPLSYLSFAVNYSCHGLDVHGYHIVNFIVHYLSSVFLFLFIRKTLTLPLLKATYANQSFNIALLSTFFWMLSPVLVSSVTYIVQRMASMAGLFYILSLYFFVCGRTSITRKKRLIHYSACFSSALVSFGIKENTAILPITMYLYDFMLIQGVNRDNLKKNWKYGVLSLLLFILMGLLYADPLTIVGGYDGLRPFTMYERLITQPRVFLYYISLLLYPTTSRLTLLHDFTISTSLLHPWTTLPAIIIVLILLAASLYSSKRHPLISFCVLFFFINHFIEGSIVSLELVYEHRNYIPSMLFFVPLSLLIIRLMESFYERKVVFYALSLSVAILLMILGISVYIQNTLFYDEVTQLMDNVEKMPKSKRSRHNLGTVLLKAGRYQEAYEELHKSLALKDTNKIGIEYYTYISLGNYHIMKQEDDKALRYIDKALNRFPLHSDLYYRKSFVLMRKNKLMEAQKTLEKAISIQRRPPYYVELAQITLKQGNPDAAIQIAREALKMNGEVQKAYGIIGSAYRAKGDIPLSQHYQAISKIR